MVTQKIMLSTILACSFVHAAQQSSNPIAIPTACTSPAKKTLPPTKFTFGNSPEALQAFVNTLKTSPRIKHLSSSPQGVVTFTFNNAQVTTHYSTTSAHESKQAESPTATTLPTQTFALKAAAALERHFGTTPANLTASAALIKKPNVEQQYNKLFNEYGEFTADDYLDRQITALKPAQATKKTANNNTSS